MLFYEPRHFLNNPLDIPAVWKGGMAFHGGLVGSIVAILLFARRFGANPWSMLDVCAAATPMGLFFGRLANFINAELWGRPTTVPWAMVFPGAERWTRHPSQLYEALLEGLVLFAVLWWLTHRKRALRRPGLRRRRVHGGLWAGALVLRALPRAGPRSCPDAWPVHRRHSLFAADDRRRLWMIARGSQAVAAGASRCPAPG